MAAQSFEETLKTATERGSKVVHGCVLGAVDSKGDYFYRKSAGYTSVTPDSDPMSEDGTMWIASCTKLITSICALQFVEQGAVTLDEPMKKHLPELADLQVLEEDKSSPEGFKLRPAVGDITLRQLLTHSSGIGYGFMSPLIQAYRKVHGPSQAELSGTVIKEYSAPLLFDPGQGWSYGGGIDWAGILVERLSGKTLGQYFEERVFGPLGMTLTTFDLDKRPDIKKKIVDCARRQPDGSLVQHGMPVFLEAVKEHSGGGGLWSTVPDYMKVLADLVKPEPTLLKKRTVEGMLAHPQLDPNGPSVRTLTQARGATGSNAAAADVGMNYGCGGLVFTKDSEQSGLPKNTLTWGGLPNLKWFINRDYGVAAMFATQVLPPGDKACTDLSSEYFKEIMRLAKERQA